MVELFPDHPHAKLAHMVKMMINKPGYKVYVGHNDNSMTTTIDIRVDFNETRYMQSIMIPDELRARVPEWESHLLTSIKRAQHNIDAMIVEDSVIYSEPESTNIPSSYSRADMIIVG